MSLSKQEVEQAAKEYSLDKSSSSVFIENHENDFIAGATMVNERHPYSKEDVNFRLADFTHWVRKNYSHTKGGYRHRGDFYRNDKPATLESLVVIYIKLWEETK